MTAPDDRARPERAEWAIAAGLVIAFLAWAWPSPLPLALAGVALAIVLAVLRPALAVALAPLTFPFTFQPRYIGSLQIAPAEAALAILLAAMALGAILVRLRPNWWAMSGHQRSARPAERLQKHVWPVVGAWRLAVPIGRPAWSWPAAVSFGWWLWALAVALLGVATASLLTVADPSHLRESLVEYRKVIVQPLVYAGLAWWALRQQRHLWLALLALLAAGALVGLLAAGQAMLGLAGVATEGVRRALGPYQHPNNLALFAGRCAALGVGLGLTWPGRAGRVVALTLAGGATLGLLLSFSRGGWLALPATVALMAALLGRRWLAAGVALATVGLLAGLPLTNIERLNRLLDGASGSGALRLELWRSTLAMLADHPITGVGLDQFLYQYTPRYVAPEAWAERFTAHPHNLLLDFWVRLGLPGLAIGLALVALTLSGAVRLARRAAGPPRALAAGAGALLGYSLLHGLVDTFFFLPDLALTFWLVVVILDRADQASAHGPTADGQARTTPMTPRIDALAGLDEHGGTRPPAKASIPGDERAAPPRAEW